MPLDGLAYWTVVDDTYERVPIADRYLRHLRVGRSRRESTTKSYAGNIAAFLGWVDERGLDLASAAAQLDDFVWWLRRTPIERQGRGVGQPRSANRVNHILAVVREFYKHAVASGEVEPAVLALLFEVVDGSSLPADLRPSDGGLAYRAAPRHGVRRERQAHPDGLTGAEFDAMLRAATSWRSRFLLALLYSTGIRIGAALGLRRTDLHFVDDARSLGCAIPGPHLHVVPRENPNQAGAKARHQFHVPVRWELVDAYESYLVERDAVPAADACDFVLVNLEREPLGAPMRYDSTKQHIARIGTRAGVPRPVRPHMFRHGHGQALAESGADLAVIKELLGHKSILSSGVYVRPGAQRLRAAVDALPPIRARDLS